MWRPSFSCGTAVPPPTRGGTLAGRQPVELDEAGRAQAAAGRARGWPRVAAGRGGDQPADPVPADPGALALPGAAPEVEHGLTECGYGDWEGQPLKTLAKDPLVAGGAGAPVARSVFPGGGRGDGGHVGPRGGRGPATGTPGSRAEQGPDALWLACSHGDMIKAIVADALGLHLDLFQRIVVDPASVTVIRYTPTRPFC